MQIKFLVATVLIVSCGALFSPSYGMEKKKQESRREEKATEALFAAIAVGDVQGLKEAIAAGANVTYRLTPLHETPLVQAIQIFEKSINGEIFDYPIMAILELLIDAGADVNFQYYWTALSHAAFLANPEIVKLLIERGADANLNDPLWHMLFGSTGCDRNITEVTRLLLEAGANPNGSDPSRTPPLSWSLNSLVCIDRKLELVKLLIAYGASPKKLTPDVHEQYVAAVAKIFRNDPIMQALALGETKEVEELLIDLYHTPFPKEKTAALKQRLHNIFLLAVAQSNTQILPIMLAHFKNSLALGQGLVIAARNGNLPLIMQINEASRMPIPVEDLSLALTAAAQRGFVDIVDYLLQQDPQNVPLHERMRIAPALSRIESILRNSNRRRDDYQQIYDLIQRHKVARILTEARPAEQGDSPFLQLPVELRAYIAQLLPGTHEHSL